MGPHRGPIFVCSARRIDEDSCSTKRASVLDAAGGPKARESPRGDSSQSLPQNLRESVVAEFDRLQNDPVTSQIVLDECKTYVDAEWPDFRLGAAGRLLGLQ